MISVAMLHGLQTLPAGPQPLWLLGNLVDFVKQGTHKVFLDWNAKYGSIYMVGCWHTCMQLQAARGCFMLSIPMKPTVPASGMRQSQGQA